MHYRPEPVNVQSRLHGLPYDVPAASRRHLSESQGSCWAGMTAAEKTGVPWWNLVHSRHNTAEPIWLTCLHSVIHTTHNINVASYTHSRQRDAQLSHRDCLALQFISKFHYVDHRWRWEWFYGCVVLNMGVNHGGRAPRILSERTLMQIVPPDFAMFQYSKHQIACITMR